MSIFDFLFARAATPEQAQKNIFLDAIDGGGRFGSGDDFRGGPLGISALLNALGVDPYGSTDAQPQGQAFAPRPPTGPARSLRPQLRPTQQMPDELLTERFGTQFALGTPSDVTTTALPRRGNPGYAFSRGDSATPAPPPAPPMGTSFGNLGNPVDMNRDLGLLAPQVVQEVTAAQPVNYYNAALRNPDFLPWMEKNYPGYFESIRANNAKAAEKELVARVFMGVPVNPRPAQTINGMPVITQEPSPPVN